MSALMPFSISSCAPIYYWLALGRSYASNALVLFFSILKCFLFWLKQLWKLVVLRRKQTTSVRTFGKRTNLVIISAHQALLWRARRQSKFLVSLREPMWGEKEHLAYILWAGLSLNSNKKLRILEVNISTRLWVYLTRLHRVLWIVSFGAHDLYVHNVVGSMCMRWWRITPALALFWESCHEMFLLLDYLMCVYICIYVCMHA